MTAKKSFLIILRVVFVLFSLQFLKDVFSKWDGYSYYMRFIDFLPDLSLVFVIWTITGLFIAVVLWLVVYGLFRIIPKTLIPIRFEHILVFLFFVMFPLFIKRTFYSEFSISELIGLNRSIIILIGLVLFVVIGLFWRKYIGGVIDKVLYGLNSRITPLVWLFVVLFVLAVPLSFAKKTPSEDKQQIVKSGVNSEPQAIVNSTKRPNIILVVMDSLTSLNLEVYGYERPTAPFIAEWAKEAIVFNKAYSASNWTTPATMSLLTGQRVWTHRVWNDIFYNPMGNYENNLPRVLRDYGYDNYAFVQNYYAHPEVFGIQNAFSVKDKYYTFWIPIDYWFNNLTDLFLDRPIVKTWISNNPIADRIVSYRPEIYTTRTPPEKVFNRFLDYILQINQRNSERPFFAYLHLWPPHFDYLPPKHYSGFFGDAEMFNSDVKQRSNFKFNKEYTADKQRDIDILRKRYDEFILYCDKQFKLFLSRLAGLIDMSNTIIILTSDHGESFSHGFLAHAGPHLYAPLVNIPLIIKIPREKGGKVINMPVEQIDIAPTVLELSEIPVPEWMEGRSMVPLLTGKTLEPRPIYSMQFRTNRSFGHPITKGTIAVWDGDYKLIYYLEDKKKLLFNLRVNHDETNNIADDKPEIAESLMKLVNNNLSRVNQEIIQSRIK